tara:strand:- start:12680 stop:13069 length:390 start_codon:yes stop_codon:yes gene_type:complete
MISEFRETKLYYENMFNTNWKATKIHFVGQEVMPKQTKKWVNPFYQPTYGNNGSLSDVCSNNGGNLHVACWATNDLDAMTLGDDVVNFIKANNDGSKYRITNVEMSDHGWNESNRVYAVITFSIQMLVN